MRLLFPRQGEDLQQVFQRIEITDYRRLEHHLNAVVSRNDSRIHQAHSDRPGGWFDCFTGKACTLEAKPVIAGGTVTEFLADSVVCAFSRIAQGAEGIREIGTGLGHRI